MKKKKAKRARATRRNPVAKAVRKIAPKVKPGKRRRTPPETAEWDDGS